MTGVSLPVVGGGVSWTPTEGPRSAARRTLAFLEDRRVLFNPYWAEQAGECVAAVLEVRRMLTDAIGGLGADETLVPHLQAMRALCRAFLDQISAPNEPDGRFRRLWVAFQPLDDRESPLVVALGELRAAMGIQIGLVATTFCLDAPESLVAILPPPPGNDDRAEPNLDMRPPW